MADDDTPDPKDAYLPRLAPAPGLSPRASGALATPTPQPTDDRAAINRALMGRLERLEQREESIEAAREKEMGREEAGMRGAIGETTRLGNAALGRFLQGQQDIPKPPDQTQMRQDALAWMSLSAAFGAIAGAFSRHHTTVALNAFTGMMTGIQKGQQLAVDENYKTWQANADRAIEYNARAQREYNAIMTNAKLNLDQRAMLMKMTADKYQDQLMSVASQQRNITQMAQLMDSQARFDESMTMRKEAIERHKMEWDTRNEQRVQQIYGSLGDAEAAKQQILNLQVPFPNESLQAKYPYLRKAAQMVVKEKPGFNAADYSANLQIQKIAATSDIVAMKTSLNKLLGVQTAITGFESLAKFNGQRLVQLAGQVDATGNTVFNRWVNAGRQATGDPDVAEFNSVLNGYVSEVAKITGNPSLTSVLTVSAKEDAKAFLPATITKGQIDRIVPRLEAEMDYRKQVNDAQVQYLQDSIQNIAQGGPRPAPFQPPAPQAPPPVAPSVSVDDFYIDRPPQ